MSDGIIRVVDDGLANQIHCKVVAPGLVSNQTEEVERVGMVWLHRKDLAVECLGFRKSAGLMVLNRDLKRRRNRHISPRMGDCPVHQARHILR